MTLDKRPNEVKIDVPMSDLSTVNFAQMLLEQIMVTAGTTEIRAGKILGKYSIGVGDLRFQAPSKDLAIRNFLFWLITSKPEMTAEAYADEAHHFFDMEDKESAQLIEELTKDGMSDFGKKIQEYRLTRGATLSGALVEIEEAMGHVPNRIDMLQDELQRRTGYDDLDAREVLAAVVDLQKMREVPDPAMET